MAQQGPPRRRRPGRERRRWRTGPAAGGGWETCDFTFEDGSSSFDLHWDRRAGAPRDRHVVANGSIRGAHYARHFGVSTDPSSPNAVGADEEITPDLDAIALIEQQI
jgi:hypothetical protein